MPDKPIRRYHPALHTAACTLFGIDVPIVQTGMGWVAGVPLAAATSEAGGLGIVAAATMTVGELRNAIVGMRALTDKPFGVNMRPDHHDLDARVALLIEAHVPVASFAKLPSEKVISRLKQANVITMATVGAKKHAEKVVKMGVDAVIAQGGEGGGHTGEVPTTLLLPQVVDVAGPAGVPVLGAGGFFDGRGLVAALSYGADGVAMGTRFLMTRESATAQRVKEIYQRTTVTDTVVTRSVDGYPQRVIRTKLVRAFERSGVVLGLAIALKCAIHFRKLTGVSLWNMFHEGLALRKRNGLTWAQVLMAANAPMLTRASMVDGRVDVGILPTGQVAGVIGDLPCVSELIERIMGEAEASLHRFERSAFTPKAVVTRSDAVQW